MGPGDIPSAIALTDLETWGCTPEIFRRLLHLDPGGCLKAVLDGETVGITTATSYGEVGWIGNVIVRPKHRGRGIGRELVESALDYLEGAGAKTVRLNSYLHVTSLDESLGFQGEFENVRFSGVMRPGENPANAVSSSNLEDVVSFDECYFGLSRNRLLERLKREFPHTFIQIQDDGVLGYLVGQVEKGSCEIAPWVVNPSSRGCARDLWRALASMVGETTVAFTAPAPCGQASAIARWAGLQKGFRTLRMFRGRRAHGGKPEGTIGLGGLEKG
jgi:GNAT superfamily N-acetyltransferase